MAAIISLRDMDRRQRGSKGPETRDGATILMFTGVRIDRSAKGLPALPPPADAAERNDER